MRCQIEGCENEADHKKAKLCSACYSSIYYWSKKTPTRQMIRVARLRVFQNRIMTLVPNVRLIRKTG